MDDSKLIYITEENFKRTDTSYGRGSNSRVNLYLTDVHNAETKQIINRNEKAIEIDSYTWNPSMSLQRRLFFDQDAISKADTLYAYLYEGNFFLIFSNRVFGLSGSQPPSSLNYHTDMIRTVLGLFVAVSAVFLGLFIFISKKYYSIDMKKSQGNKSQDILFTTYVFVIVFLAFLAV